MKRNLQQKAQLDRLVGQVHGLQPKTNRIIVLFCGATNPTLVNRFKEVFGAELSSMFDDAPHRMALVVKEPAKTAKAGK